MTTSNCNVFYLTARSQLTTVQFWIINKWIFHLIQWAIAHRLFRQATIVELVLDTRLCTTFSVVLNGKFIISTVDSTRSVIENRDHFTKSLSLGAATWIYVYREQRHYYIDLDQWRINFLWAALRRKYSQSLLRPWCRRSFVYCDYCDLLACGANEPFDRIGHKPILYRIHVKILSFRLQGPRNSQRPNQWSLLPHTQTPSLAGMGHRHRATQMAYANEWFINSVAFENLQQLFWTIFSLFLVVGDRFRHWRARNV